MRAMRRLLLLVIVTFACIAAAGQPEVIMLKYRSTEQMIPVIRPLLARGGSVSGLQNELVIRTSKANLAEIRKVIERLDTMPRRLMIYVRQDAKGAGANAVGHSARVYETRGASDDQVSQRVQVLEGDPALIKVRRSMPVQSQTLVQGPGGMMAGNSVNYRDFTTGFEVVARVSGEQVLLKISPQREAPTDALGGGKYQGATTTASGRLGEWFEIAGSDRNASGDDSAVILGAAGERKDQRSIWVKVEEIN